MRISDDGLALICRFEGFRARIYYDAAGLRTIGYGHLLEPGEDFYTEIDADRGLALLRKDVEIAGNAVSRFICVQLAQTQFDALVSFTFNLGAAVLQRSTLRRKINTGYFTDVPHQLMRYVWAGGRKQQGLIRRRAAEASLFIS